MGMIETTGRDGKPYRLTVPVVWRGRKFRYVTHACRAFPHDDPKLIRWHAARQLAEAVWRTRPPPQDDLGDLPDVPIPGIEPPPKSLPGRKPKRAPRPEPTPEDLALADLCRLPDIDMSLFDF